MDKIRKEGKGGRLEERESKGVEKGRKGKPKGRDVGREQNVGRR